MDLEFNNYNTSTSNYNFNALRLRLASPEEIKSWSHGEVIKPDTINYRTQKPEKDGLFSERIFGPVKDYECACGKYKRMRYKGIVCDKCGVEVTKSIVRRERMGHIGLAVPVAHIWFLRNLPSRMGLVLDIPLPQIEKVVYYTAYIITKVDEEAKKQVLIDIDKEYKSKLKAVDSDQKQSLLDAYNAAKNEAKSIERKAVLSEAQYYNLSKKYGQIFEAATGSTPIFNLLKDADLEAVVKELRVRLTKATGESALKINRRLKLIEQFITSKARPEWMFLTNLPVLPPDLRPMVQLDGGRYASYDLNDLYRRVINRNNRLKKLMELKAPEVIIRNEKRMLQEAVDALLDNGMRRNSGSALQQSQHRPLRSLADILKGKQGRFRQNLLGKRVDFSGRSVIVIGPELDIDECGIPKTMALEIFKPFVIKELKERGLVFSIKAAHKMIEDGTDQVWEILEEIIKNKLVLLNRAPTLHRLGIEAFKPTLVEGLAIRIPALVCEPFNADFDGDQMAVHLPLSDEAQNEAKTRMLSSLGLLKPASGAPAMSPRHEMVAGCFWLTQNILGSKGEGLAFNDEDEAVMAQTYGQIDLRATIKVRKIKGDTQYKPLAEANETTVGRIIFNRNLPDDYPFINQSLVSKDFSSLTNKLIEKYGVDITAHLIKGIQTLGFEYATLAGLSWSMDSIHKVPEKQAIIDATDAQVASLEEQYNEGLLTKEEKERKEIVLWTEATDKISDSVKKLFDPTEATYTMIASGARGSWNQIMQMMGMKGLVVNPAGEIIKLPIKASYKEGLNALEYFLSTHASRKGQADTALHTADAGYLTRRLVDVAQSVVIREEDCHTDIFIEATKDYAQKLHESFYDLIYGRCVAENFKEGEVDLKEGDMITREVAREIDRLSNPVVKIRTPLTCKSHVGVCQKCYGADLATNRMIQLGEAVGVVAAQSIGEPGTQLTLKNFHSGGVARAVDITQGLPRVEEIIEARPPKGEVPVVEVEGIVDSIVVDGPYHIIKVTPIVAKEKTLTKRGRASNRSAIQSNVKIDEFGNWDYYLAKELNLYVKKNDRVQPGQSLSEGSLNPKVLHKVAGRRAVEEYLIQEIRAVYSLVNEAINDRHLEVIVRQMLSRVQITDAGDSIFVAGEIADKYRYLDVRDEMIKNKQKPPEATQILTGITKVAENSNSFLASASFQKVAYTLIEAALEGKIDYLRGMKENVIIGRLIPAGTGYKIEPQVEA